jgi:uncharacterized protein (TIGR02145 family)
VPSDEEWTKLEDYLGGSDVAGKKLKSTQSLEARKVPLGTNSSGFSALPGGLRDFFGYFHAIGYYGYWWSSTEGSSADAWCRKLSYEDGKSYRDYGLKQGGFSVRCLRD